MHILYIIIGSFKAVDVYYSLFILCFSTILLKAWVPILWSVISLQNKPGPSNQQNKDIEEVQETIFLVSSDVQWTTIYLEYW